MRLTIKVMITATVSIGAFVCGTIVYKCHYVPPKASITVLWPLSLPGMEKRKAIMKQGDIVAYHQLVDSVKRMRNMPYPTYLFYSMVMANIYNYAPANYDVFEALNTLFSPRNKIDSMDVNTARIAFFFLKRGKDMGDLKACMEWRKQEILRRYGKGINANLELDL